MSGVVKGIKKVFKKVAKVVKKIIKPVAIAVAVYFTAGVALSYMGPAAAGFSAGLPGFSGAAGAGPGIFSTAAAKIGLGSGLAKAAYVAGTPLAALEATYGASAVTAATASAGSAGVSAAGGGVTAAATTGAVTKAGMTFGQKLLLASQGANLAAAVFGPTASEQAEADAAAEGKWRGAFYGMTADGEGGGLVPPLAPTPSQRTTGAAAPQQTAVPPPSPEQQQLEAGRQAKTELFPTTRKRPDQEPAGNVGLYGSGQMKQQIPVPEGINSPAPGVRYVEGVQNA